MRAAYSVMALATTLAIGGCTIAPHVPAPAPATALFDREGYRTSHYRAPVGAAPIGVARLSTAEVQAMIARHRALLIDVMPAEGGHRDSASGHWTLAVDRPTLPDARWFPEAGRAPLDPPIEQMLRQGIAALHRRHPDATLIVFCRADCWMSWNAARRLRRWGYRHVAWYADGTDGWSERNLPLISARPTEETGFE